MSDESLSSKNADQLAVERTQLALERTRIAADRTLMAWIRTSVSLTGFGFTIYKFLQYLQEAEHARIGRPNSPRNLGAALIALGTLGLIAAMIQHQQLLKRLGQQGLRPQLSIVLMVAVCMALIGVITFIGVLVHIGPF
jgi:putative membrane protein